MTPLELIGMSMLALIEAAALVRAILRPHREPASRIAWAVVIVALPVAGVIAYLLTGEVRISLKRRLRGREIEAKLPRPPGNLALAERLDADFYAAPFALGRSINGLPPTGGNRVSLAADSNAAIDSIVEDIDAAAATVHLSAYIWLGDNNGCKIKDALIRAANRGVAVRAMADALGSRLFIRSAHWRELAASGVQVRVALPVGNPLWTFIRGRVDLRNHRKLLIADNRIAWIGSQNFADPEFRIKPRYAPWVDVMTRWEGPVARHCQYLFVSDWVGDGGEDISELLAEPCPSGPRGDGGAIAQVIGTGPTVSYDSMPSCFAELMHSARHELVITTPYFVPNDQVLFALTSAARRGVAVVLALPKRNDSIVVAGTSRSFYQDLVSAGVRLFEYRRGLLHAKTIVVDRKLGLIGSANLDRRSFDLNFENNILFADEAFAAVLRARQEEYLTDSERVTQALVDSFGIAGRLWQNSLAMLSPIL